MNFIPVSEAALMSGRKESDLLALARRGRIPAWRIGRAWFTSIDAARKAPDPEPEPDPSPNLVKALGGALRGFLDDHSSRKACRCALCKNARLLLGIRPKRRWRRWKWSASR